VRQLAHAHAKWVGQTDEAFDAQVAYVMHRGDFARGRARPPIGDKRVSDDAGPTSGLARWLPTKRATPRVTEGRTGPCTPYAGTCRIVVG
jgi:hypothetical protein